MRARADLMVYYRGFRQMIMKCSLNLGIHSGAPDAACSRERGRAREETSETRKGKRVILKGLTRVGGAVAKLLREMGARSRKRTPYIIILMQDT